MSLLATWLSVTIELSAHLLPEAKMELKPNMTPAERAAYIEELDRLESEVGCLVATPELIKEFTERRNKRAQEKLKVESKEV